MTKVKICGLTNLADAQVALEAGADLLGFIFHPPSPRYVEPERVGDIVDQLRQAHPDRQFQAVGVFVNRPLDVVQTTLSQCGLDLAQLHGDEEAAFLTQLEGQAFKAINPQSLGEAETLVRTYAPAPETLILLDAYHSKLRGGTGHTADWAMAAQVAQDRRLLLAGGLTPANVAPAIAQVRPWGVDVSSGVEASKGKKDHAKVRTFIETVKGED